MKPKKSQRELAWATNALYGDAPIEKFEKRKYDNEESRLQQACVKWFDLQYPELYRNLWAIPNGGNRNAVTGAIMKREGVRPGVSDLMFYYKGQLTCIEMKKPGDGTRRSGTMSIEQIKFINAMDKEGAKTYVCDSFEGFQQIIREAIG
jgi:hypothetical protein